MKLGPVSLCILAILGLATSLPTASVPVLAEGVPPPFPGVCSQADRFGVWAAERSADSYPISQIGAGWYSWWETLEQPPHPAGLRFAQLVRISHDGPLPDAECSRCPTWEQVARIAASNPGSLWLIGNEPDRQDWTPAGRYAEIYHNFYFFLKAQDPSCLVAPGGVVQPTPIRLQYLDMILAAYQERYGQSMPVDVWNVHNYVLREGTTGWGCGIPPGTDPALAKNYSIQDHDNMVYWTRHLVEMRQWMADRGYQDRPLIISEFGILMPEMYGYDYPRVKAFMIATFDWLTAASDDETGYPLDGNRLVQQWAWYSLDDKDYEGWTSWNHLFDPDTRAITALGLDFGAYTSPLTVPYVGSIDLHPGPMSFSLPQTGPTGLLTTTVTVSIANEGAAGAQDVVVRLERDGAAAEQVTIPIVPAGGSETVSAVWSDLNPGWHQGGVAVDPDGLIVECDRSNNGWRGSLLIGVGRAYLPLIARGR